VSTADDDDAAPARDVHETLLPSLHLSVLGGVSSIGVADQLTPLPEALSSPALPPVVSDSGPAGSPAPFQPVLDETGRPRGARPGDTIGGRYVVEGQVGRGGMGRVLRVRHQVLGKAFALKLIKTPIATDPRIREMFYREARLASALTHDNICSIVDFGQDPAFGLFMVMELLDGQTVHSRLRTGGRLAPKVACDIVWQAADALRYIHSRAILHGDIKSENIFLVRSAVSRRSVKLLDFGLARQDLGRGTGQVDGTPEYLAPERIQGLPASTATDIYALGIVFFEMLTGRLPFTGDLEQVFRGHLDEAVPAPSSLIDEPIDERADEIVARATAKNPSDRHADVAGFLYELRTLMNMLGMEVGRRRPGPTAEGGRERRGEVDHRAKAASEVFQWAPLPLACVDATGKVRVANQAFLDFIGVAGDAGGIELRDSGFCEVCPTLLDDLRTVAVRHQAIKRVIYLSEGGGSMVEAALVLTPPPSSSEVTAGEVHLTLHPLRNLKG
jgi:tRNA A-37 threonylcarbamoyl transferase component Bud32